jgi:hypothetical protein
MTGAILAGIGGVCLGVPGMLVGLVIAFVYYGRHAKP